MPSAPITKAWKHTSVPSTAQRPTMLSPGPAECVPQGHLRPTNPAFLPMLPTILNYHDFSNTIVHQDPSILTSSHCFNDIYLRIVHPYDIAAFDQFLSKNDLKYFYPLLLLKLRQGFPLGEMPSLADTVIFKNHPSMLIYPDAINNYLTDELSAGRMSGPFSLQYAEKALRGAILCSPLLVSVQVQQPSKPDKLRVCHHLSKGDKNTPLMNYHIQKEDFPTHFDTASKVADIVSSFHWSAMRSLSISMGFTILWPFHSLSHILWPYYHSLVTHHSHTIISGHTSWLYFQATSREPSTSMVSPLVIQHCKLSLIFTFFMLLFDTSSLFVICPDIILLSSNSGRQCPLGNPSLHVQYREISPYMCCPPCPQAFACCPKLTWWLLHWPYTPIRSSGGKQQCRYDWQCYCWHLASRRHETHPKIQGWSKNFLLSGHFWKISSWRLWVWL